MAEEPANITEEDSFEDEFDPNAEEEDINDVDIDDIDEDIDEDNEETASPSPRKKDDYSDAQVASALIANPKRQQARRKNVSLIEGLINQNELETEDGLLRAWNALKARAKQSDVPPKTYAINAELKEGDFFEHPTFGHGFVIETLSPTKIQTLFEDGLRKLVCNFKK